MAKKAFPDYADCVSMALTPMTLTARLIKPTRPGAKVAFIGPCSAKKLEAMDPAVRSEVDFVLTFEEMTGIFAARRIDLNTIEDLPGGVNDSSSDGRAFAVSGGVARAVADVIAEKYPDHKMQVASAEGLKECKKLMALAKAGRYQGYLLEGMACPGGCVAGAGTRQPVNKAPAFVKAYAGEASHQTADQTESVKELKHLVGEEEQM